MAKGRKRKSGKRHACGKRVRKVIEEDAMTTAIEARQRQHGVTAKQARDVRLGSALGRLAFRGEISEAQYQSGLAFAALYRRHHLTLGLPLPSPVSIAGILVNEGIFGGSPSEPLLDAIDAVKRRFAAATDALDQCDRDQRLSTGNRPTLLVYRVVCAEEDTTLWSIADIGNLRVALNALVRVFRFASS